MKHLLTEREEQIKSISIEYVNYKKKCVQAVEDYKQKRSWGILDHLLVSEKEKIEYLEDICLSLDISLGYIVEQGDKEKIPEYAEALKIG